MKPRLRLQFIDGLRGLAALFVMLSHVNMELDWRFISKNGVLTPTGDPLPPRVKTALRVFDLNHFAVAVFIVLSGYCLMLPVAHSKELHLPGGMGRYIQRRARRILPGYYAALFLTLIAIASIPLLRHAGDLRWGTALPAFTPGVLISHLLLIHNLNPHWSGKINSPLWSIPPEWQIYFLFPLLLLPLVRRFGLLLTNAFALAITITPHFIWHGSADYACMWYLALFAFGNTAAMVNHSPLPRMRQFAAAVPWGMAALLIWGFCLGLFIFIPGWALSRTYAMDPLVGAATSILLVYLADQGGPDRLGRLVLLGFLESDVMTWLGTISYSLYLVHSPILTLVHAFLRWCGLTGMTRAGALFAAGTVASLAVAYVFHRLFERPFMIGHPKSQAQAAKSAAVEPAI